MDSACSRHMTGKKHKFLSLAPMKGGKVALGDGRKGTVVRVGKIGRNESRALEELYHVDGFKHNLLNISHLCDKGNKVIFTSAGCRVKKLDTKKIVLLASRHKNVYKATVRPLVLGHRRKGQ